LRECMKFKEYIYKYIYNIIYIPHSVCATFRPLFARFAQLVAQPSPALRNSSPSRRPLCATLLIHSPDFVAPNLKINLGFQVKLGVLDPKAASTTSDKLHIYLTAMDPVAVDRRLPAGRCSVHNMDLGLARRFPRLSVTDPRQR
jgi:hypothetical protein